MDYFKSIAAAITFTLVVTAYVGFYFAPNPFASSKAKHSIEQLLPGSMPECFMPKYISEMPKEKKMQWRRFFYILICINSILQFWKQTRYPFNYEATKSGGNQYFTSNSYSKSKMPSVKKKKNRNNQDWFRAGVSPNNPI